MDDEKERCVKESLLLYSTKFVLYVEDELDIMTSLKNEENVILDNSLFFKKPILINLMNNVIKNATTSIAKSNKNLFVKIGSTVITYSYNEIKNRYEKMNLKDLLGKCEKLMKFRKRNEIKFRNMLIKGAFDIFQSFENIFMRVKETGYTHEKAIIQLAKLSATKAIDYFMNNSDDLENQSISQAIMRGYSNKSLRLISDDGRKITDPMKIFSKPGIVILHENSTTYCENEKSRIEKYGSRRLLHWEDERILSNDYTPVQNPNKPYLYVLNSSNVDIEVGIISKEISKIRNKAKKTFRIRSIQNYGREEKWTEKILEHFNKKQNVVISGPSGVGKSTLAYKFAEIYEGDAFWFDAEGTATLWTSAKAFCKSEMERIKLKNDSEERSLNDVFNDIYKKFQHKKTLFIFDNVSSYSAIEHVLPINFGTHLEHLNILITSTNAKSGEWDNPFIPMCEIKLEYFSEIESRNVLKQILQISDNSQDDDLDIFGKRMNYFPVALVNAASDWKNVKEHYGKCDYLEEIFSKQDFEWKHKMKALFESQVCHLKKQGEVEKKGLKMWKMMSYFSWNQIPKKFFAQYLTNGDVQKHIQICKVLQTYSKVTLSDEMLSMNECIQEISRQVFINSEEITLHEIIERFLNIKMIMEKYYEDEKDELMEYISHIMSVWEYACKYDNLIEEFIENCLTNKKKIFSNVAKPEKKSQNMIFNDQYGSFLYLIIKYGKFETMKIILEKLNIKHDIENYDPGQKPGKKQYYHPLFRKTKRFHKSLFHYAVESGKKEVVTLLLTYIPKDINNINKIKHTPLHLAVKNGFTEIVGVLLDNNADVEIQTTHGYTALHYGASLGNVKIVQSLLKKSADVNSKTNQDFTPLHFAASSGNVEIVQSLLYKSADENSKTEDDFTLKKRNIEIDAMTTSRMTPLHLAVREGRRDIAAYLLSKGSNPNLLDGDGLAPIHVAAKKDDLKMVNMLLTHDKIDLTLKTTQNKTALDLATQIDIRDAIEGRMRNIN